MSEHEAGQKLDEQVAEKVMGWTPWVSPSQPRGSTSPDCWRTGVSRRPSVRMSGWRPSEDIAAAWEVVEQVWASVVPKTAYGVYRFGLNRLDTGLEAVSGGGPSA